MPFVFKLLTGTLVIFNSGFLTPCDQEVPPTIEQARKGVTIKVAPAPVHNDSESDYDDLAQRQFGDLSKSDVARIREWIDSLPKEYLIDLTESFES